MAYRTSSSLRRLRNNRAGGMVRGEVRDSADLPAGKYYTISGPGMKMRIFKTATAARTAARGIQKRAGGVVTRTSHYDWTWHPEWGPMARRSKKRHSKRHVNRPVSKRRRSRRARRRSVRNNRRHSARRRSRR